MNKEELKQNIENMELEIAKMKQELNKPEEIKMFPQEGEEYWYYVPNGMIYTSIAGNNEGRAVAFRTQEEAERARDIAFAKMRVKHAIEVANNDWTPDWNDASQRKYLFYKNKVEGGFRVEYWFYNKFQPNWMHMKSEEIAEKILENHREDLELIFSE